MACYRFRGHEDKIVIKELESGYDRRKFCREFKFEAVRLVMERGVAVARDLDVARKRSAAVDAGADRDPSRGVSR